MNQVTAMGQALIDAERRAQQTAPVNGVPRYMQLYRSLLAQRGVSKNDLLKCTGLPAGTVSQYLTTLRRAGVVTKQPTAAGMQYRAIPKPETEVQNLVRAEMGSRALKRESPVAPPKQKEPVVPASDGFSPEKLMSGLTISQAVAVRDYLNQILK